MAKWRVSTAVAIRIEYTVEADTGELAKAIANVWVATAIDRAARESPETVLVYVYPLMSEAKV